MLRWLTALTVLAAAAASDVVTIGNQEMSSGEPFCCSWIPSLRYQAVVLDNEIGGAFTIETLSMKRHSSGSTTAPTDLFDFALYMGLCANDALGSTFDANFIPGTRTLVFSRDSLHIEVNPDELISIDLDTPYWYNGQDNLIVEILWSAGEESGTECVYTWQWNTGAMRCASGLYTASSGSLTSIIPWMQITGGYSLESCTFAEVKTLFAGD